MNLSNSQQTDLSGKVAIITGGGRGIGAATAKLFSQAGAKVVVAARSSSELNDVSGIIRDAGGTCLPIRADMTSEDDIVKLFETTSRILGPVDILINNAGAAAVTPIKDMTIAAWDHVFNVNIRGVFLCCREAFKYMAGRGGIIVNVTSLGGLRGYEKFPGLSAYNASKFAVTGFTESLALEGRAHGIRVNGVAPGAVETKLLRDAAPHLKTNTSPDDIAKTILFLADDAKSKAISGDIIEINSNL